MLNLILEEHNQMSKAIDNIVRSRDLDEFNKVALCHQVDEERLMIEVGYSGYLAHRMAHREVAILIRSMNTDCDLVELKYILHKLLAEHISEFDMPLLNGLEMDNDSKRNSGNQTRNEG
jgi:hemerythrin